MESGCDVTLKRSSLQLLFMGLGNIGVGMLKENKGDCV
jgi:hypothetical protein